MTERGLRASDVLWRKVRDVDGRSVGRVYDLVAERRGDELRVTGLLVGKNNLVVRFGWATGQGQTIPWDRVVRLEPEVVIQADGGML